MAHRNIHQRKKKRAERATTVVKPVAQTPPIAQPLAAAPAKPTGLKTPVVQEPVAVRFAELPYELRRIALFSAFVVVLLIALWFILK
jgi:hypothetical protein